MGVPIDIRSRDGSSASTIADQVVSQWQAIDDALTPIIGGQGVAALYRRSLVLSARTHTWLAPDAAADAATMDLERLRALLASRESEHAAAGGQALLHTFLELLTSFIGASLAERLLGPIGALSSSGSAAQDTSQ